MVVDLSRPTQAWNFFRNTLGSPRLIMAPMVDGSELAFRMMCRSLGADLCISPMINASVFVRQPPNSRLKVFTTCEQDRPLGVQFAANDPKTLLQAALMVQDQCDFVDINLGCPQKIAKRGHYGAWLLKEVDLIEAMVRTLAENLSIPVTCKIRLCDTVEQTLELCSILQRSGCSMITVHGRRKEQLKDLVGCCDWDAIRIVKSSVDIPVVANGGIYTLADVAKCQAITGADAVMSSEALLANPGLFAGHDPTPISTMIQHAEIYLDYAERYEASLSQIFLHVTKILFRALQAIPQVRYLICVSKQRNIASVREALRLLQYPDAEQLLQMPSWYMRHRIPYKTVQ